MCNPQARTRPGVPVPTLPVAAIFPQARTPPGVPDDAGGPQTARALGSRAAPLLRTQVDTSGPTNPRESDSIRAG